METDYGATGTRGETGNNGSENRAERQLTAECPGTLGIEKDILLSQVVSSGGGAGLYPVETGQLC